MKKFIPVLISLVIAVGVFACSYFVVDRKQASIVVTGTPMLACDVDMDDLLEYASVEDDDLKSLIIEENDILDILKTSKLTYVAIDDNNNVSKLKVDVDIEEGLDIVHIEEIKPLEINVNNNINTNEYFALVNKCGWKNKAEFRISGVDNKTNGEYSGVVSCNNVDCDDLNVLFKVVKDGAPTIHLVEPIHYAGENEIFSEYYFDNLVDEIIDDKDSLIYANINWQDILIKNDEGYYDEGTYFITYDVEDSDGNIGKSTLMLIIDEQYNIEEPVVIIEESIEEVVIYE